MTTDATWRPDGGPEAVRQTWNLTDEAVTRFRAHRISGGHQKWPDQVTVFNGDWYVRPPKAQAETALREMRDKFRGQVASVEMFDRLIQDDGLCGAADWSVDGVRVTSTSIWSAYYACRIAELVEGRDIRSVVDIGGGYGHLAHVLARAFDHVVLVELPAVLALAREWSARHPATAGRVRLAHPCDDWSGDLVINTMSMQHMTVQNLIWYGARFRATPPRAVYLVNRSVKRDPTDTPIREYPFLSLFECASERMLTDRHVEWFGVR